MVDIKTIGTFFKTKDESEYQYEFAIKKQQVKHINNHQAKIVHSFHI